MISFSLHPAILPGALLQSAVGCYDCKMFCYVAQHQLSSSFQVGTQIILFHLNAEIRYGTADKSESEIQTGGANPASDWDYHAMLQMAHEELWWDSTIISS